MSREEWRHPRFAELDRALAEEIPERRAPPRKTYQASPWRVRHAEYIAEKTQAVAPASGCFSRNPVLTEILRTVAAVRLVTPADILGDSRRREVVEARHDVFTELRELGWSYPMIGRALHKHHTTVMHGVRKRGAHNLPPTLPKPARIRDRLAEIEGKLDRLLDLIGASVSLRETERV